MAIINVITVSLLHLKKTGYTIINKVYVTFSFILKLIFIIVK